MNLFTQPLHDLATQANKIRVAKHGTKSYFVRNIQLNCTNICIYDCLFCAYKRKSGEDGAYFMSVDDAVEYVATNAGDAVEIHMTGGIPANITLDYYVELLGALKKNFPDKAIKGLTCVEIDVFARRARLDYATVLRTLKTAGLDMLPGGGAEIFAPHVRNKICKGKLSADEWLNITEIAHNEGIRSNATMLFGHIESYDDRMNHLEQLRELQHKTNGFNAFIPLTFHPQNTQLDHIKKSTAVDQLKTIAVSRIVLDNISHIKGYWVMLGESIAQMSLYYGADDLDGTIVKERITHAAGATSREGLSGDDMVFLIQSAGLTPVERDAYYNELKIYA